MNPSLGRICHYVLTDQDVSELEKMASDFGMVKQENKVVAAFIIKSITNQETEKVNLIVISELGDVLIKYNVIQGIEKGQWHEPPRIK